MTDINNEKRAPCADHEIGHDEGDRRGRRFVVGNPPSASSVTQQPQIKAKGRLSPRDRRRQREKNRRDQFIKSLGLLADALVRIDPGLREGGASGGCSVRNPPQLLEAAIMTLQRLHYQNETNKRIMNELNLTLPPKQAPSNTATTSSTPFESCTGVDSQPTHEVHGAVLSQLEIQRGGTVPHQNERIQLSEERLSAQDHSTTIRGHLALRSLEQRLMQPFILPLSLEASATVLNASAQGGFIGTLRNQNNNDIGILCNQNNRDLATPLLPSSADDVAAAGHLRRSLLALRLQLATLPLSIDGERSSIVSLSMLPSTPSPDTSTSVPARGQNYYMFPHPLLPNSPDVPYSSALRESEAFGGTGHLQSRNNPLGVSDTLITSAPPSSERRLEYPVLRRDPPWQGRMPRPTETRSAEASGRHLRD